LLLMSICLSLRSSGQQAEDTHDRPRTTATQCPDRPPRSVNHISPRLVSGLWSGPLGDPMAPSQAVSAQWLYPPCLTPPPLRGQRRISTGFPILRLPSRRHLEIDIIIIPAPPAALLQCDIGFEIDDRRKKIFGDAARPKYRKTIQTVMLPRRALVPTPTAHCPRRFVLIATDPSASGL
jgi:hypothetical protein